MVPLALVRSFRRSEKRLALARAVVRLGRAYPQQLAVAAGVPPHRVVAMVAGAPPQYSRRLGLRALGLARLEVDGHGVVVVARPGAARVLARLEGAGAAVEGTVAKR